MTNSKYIYLVFGVTGKTGRHFVVAVLNEGHKVIALVHDTEKANTQSPNSKLIKRSFLGGEVWIQKVLQKLEA